jgi:hypothetical protein
VPNLQHIVAGAQHHAAQLGFVHVGVHDADFRSMKDCRLDKENFRFIGLHKITSPDAMPSVAENISRVIPAQPGNRCFQGSGTKKIRACTGLTEMRKPTALPP